MIACGGGRRLDDGKRRGGIGIEGKALTVGIFVGIRWGLCWLYVWEYWLLVDMLAGRYSWKAGRLVVLY